MKHLFLLLTLPLAASWCNYKWEGGAEALYWKPCNAPLPYGEFAHPGGDRARTDIQLQLVPDYEWGFRLYGQASTRCSFANLEWAHVNGATQVTTIDSDPTRNLVAFPWINSTGGLQAGAIFARQDTRYNKVSLKLGRNFSCLKGYFGGRYVDLRVIKKLNPSGTNPTGLEVGATRSETTFCSGGIEAGLGARVDIWCGIGLDARAGLHALAGTRDHKYEQFLATNGSINRRNVSSLTLCTGGFEVRGGLNYTYRYGCFGLRGEIGYELDQYFDLIVDEQPSVQSPSTLSNNFAIGGPYIGLSLTY